MLLQRFTDRLWQLAAVSLLLLSVGCATQTAEDAPYREASLGSARPADGMPEAAQGPQIAPEVQTLYEQAAAALAAGDNVDAELRFKEFVLLHPQFPGAHVNLAIIHAANGNDDATREALQAALALDPDHPQALNQLGMLLRRNGNFPEAEAAYMKAVTVSPDYALAHYNLGVLNELYLRRLDQALQHFEAYQALVGEDKQVAKWITDLKRRTAANQRTANVAE